MVIDLLEQRRNLKEIQFQVYCLHWKQYPTIYLET